MARPSSTEPDAVAGADLARWREPVPFLLHGGKRDRGYVPSYDWGGDVLSDRHDRVADSVWDVPGWLAREDAMKLYELAFFAPGPILEIGTYCGRSVITMATALTDAGRRGPIVSVDTDPGAVMLAHRYVRSHRVEEKVVFVCQSVGRFLEAMPGYRPSLVFVDGDHSADGVRSDLEALEPCLLPGALVLFHDYLPADVPDAAGFPMSPEPIEVREALAGSWLYEDGEFAGTFGRSALFRIVREVDPDRAGARRARWDAFRRLRAE
jgi:cephalosporin hydroxylase